MASTIAAPALAATIEKYPNPEPSSMTRSPGLTAAWIAALYAETRVWSDNIAR